MSRSFSMPLGKLGGHATVQLGRSTAPAGLQLRRDISTTQRRLRQALRPRPVQLRLRAPLKGRKAVQAHRVQMEIERLKGSRFSPVHEKPRVPTQLSKACMKALGFTGLKATGSSIASSSFNFLKATTLSLLGHGPIDWRTSILFIDLANSVRGLKVHMRRTGPPMNVTRRILMDLVHISKLRGCQVYVMVEGIQRTMTAPDGLQMIRARPIKRKDIGDDAIVERVHETLEQGLAASRLVLITGDKGLIRRMPSGVHWRRPKWLGREIRYVLRNPNLFSAPAAANEPGDTDATEPTLDSENWWSSWWGSLKRLPTLLFASVGPKDSHRREEVARTGQAERS